MRSLILLPIIWVVILTLLPLGDVRTLPLRSLKSLHSPRDLICWAEKCPTDSSLLSSRAPIPPVRISGGKAKSKGSGSGSSKGPDEDPAESSAGAPPRIGADSGAQPAEGGETDPVRITAEPASQPKDKAIPAPHAEAEPATAQAAGGENKASPDYNEFIKKGQDADAERAAAVRDSLPDKPLTNLNGDKYQEAKIVEDQVLDTRRERDLVDPLKEAGVDVEKSKYGSSEIKSRGQDADEGEVIVESKIYGQDGVIVAERRFAASDTNTGDKARLSDILWSKYAQEAKENTNKLKALVGSNINNKGLLDTIETAQKRTNKDPKKHNIFKRDAESQEERDAFSALIGTQGLRSVNYMLKDHHTAAGNKQITEIHTFPEDFNMFSNRNGRQSVSILAKMG